MPCDILIRSDIGTKKIRYSPIVVATARPRAAPHPWNERCGCTMIVVFGAFSNLPARSCQRGTTKERMAKTFSDVTCTVCGCACDDLQVTVHEDCITHVERAC